MVKEECKHFGRCFAPLCPISGKEKSYLYIWYPDEKICSLRKFQTLDWVKKQKLIAKRHGSVAHFFTIRMLQAIKRVSRGITGIDPDNKRDTEKQWLKTRRSPRKCPVLVKKGGIT